jgi:hypothetical protein
MRTRTNIPPVLNPLARLCVLLALCTFALAPATWAQTAGGTQIQNRAAATYSDGTNNYSTVSNTVTVTVANVSGLAITPDAGSLPTVVSGQQEVDFNFTVTNTGNFATQVRFLASGGSFTVTGPATVALAGVDANGDGTLDADDNGVIDAGDVSILGGSDVSYPASSTVASGATFTVIVRVNVNSGATAGASINVRLGDASGGGPTFDNQPVNASNLSTAKVRTATPTGTTAPVNGESEARGDISTSVENDAQLRLSLNVPAGPVALGSNITYTFSVENTGQRTASPQTLAGAPAGSNTGVFVVAPIPVGTSFSSLPALPAGVTALYSTSALGADPGPGDPPATGPVSASVVWTTTPPAVLSDVRRVAFRVNNGNALAVAATVSNLSLVLTVQTNINASNPLYGIGDAFARNSINSPITDQSGDVVSNKGDGNANFNEPKRGVPPAADEAVSLNQGYQQPTTLLAEGSVLLGPVGFPEAVGPTSTNDDYTNKTVPAAAIAGVAFGGNTLVISTVDFVNTVRNTGNANDVYTFTAPTVPTDFTVAISTDGGTSFTTVSGGGSTTLAVGFGQQANITVRVTAPAGKPVLNGFETVIRATSANTSTNSNDTIDRLYTGFLRLDKTFTVTNGTGVGGATDAVPGAVIEYTITYTNISSSGGTNNVTLTASSIVITEDGTPSATNPNNWGSTTNQVVGSASDTRDGNTTTAGITGDAAGSTLLTDTIPSLAPGKFGVFKFSRTIK